MRESATRCCVSWYGDARLALRVGRTNANAWIRASYKHSATLTARMRVSVARCCVSWYGDARLALRVAHANTVVQMRAWRRRSAVLAARAWAVAARCCVIWYAGLCRASKIAYARLAARVRFFYGRAAVRAARMRTIVARRCAVWYADLRRTLKAAYARLIARVRVWYAVRAARAVRVMQTWEFIGASAAAGVVLAMAGGYFIGSEWSREALRLRWQSEITEQQQLLAEDNAARSAELALLAGKIGLFEARLTRLDVLGSQLVDLYGLDQEEFHFLDDPGIGGNSTVDYDVDGLRVTSLMSEVDSRIKARELQLSVLKEAIGRDELAKEMKPLGWPVGRGWLSSKFGFRISSFSGRREHHAGVDIAGVEGTPIHAVGSGIVKYARTFKNYGNMVEIDHGSSYSTRYAHNQINLVTEGQIVKQGDVIALLGNTGRSTGPHLHFEVLKNNRQINPGKYLLAR